MITYDNGHPLGPLSPDEQRWDVVLERLWGQVWPNIGRKPTRKCPARLPSSTRQVHHPGFPRCLLQGCLPRGGPVSCFEAASNICFVSLPWGLPPPRTPGLGGLPLPDLGQDHLLPAKGQLSLCSNEGPESPIKRQQVHHPRFARCLFQGHQTLKIYKVWGHRCHQPL